MSLRDAGYRGRLVSFEPLSHAHELLQANAGNDPDWLVAPRMAIGAEPDEKVIHISGNSANSSLLVIGSGSTAVLPITEAYADEAVSIVPLDHAVEADWPGPYAVKIDTQGFEMEVLRGANRVLDQTRLLNIELSLADLYEGGARVADVFALLEARGFRAIAVTEGFSDVTRNEMLQVDATFLRK